jgi:hypothetical protein
MSAAEGPLAPAATGGHDAGKAATTCPATPRIAACGTTERLDRP